MQNQPKPLTLFDEIAQTAKPTKTQLSGYEGFVEKFKPKKTTDDCYTPPAIYEAVLEYVGKNYDLSDKQIIRPFYPNGDYKNAEYPDNSVVVDNPPFSIITEIARFYTVRKIPFFIFAPHLTLFTANIDCSHIVVGASIIYENGAVVNTSFLSNLFGDIKILACSELYKKFKDIQDANKANLPKYVYPDNVIMVSQLNKIVQYGIDFKIMKGETAHYTALKSQKEVGKTMFGGGFLISEKAAAEKAAAEKAAAEKAAAEKAAAEKAAAEKAAAEKAAAEKQNVIVWELSPKEWDIIKSLRESEHKAI